MTIFQKTAFKLQLIITSSTPVFLFLNYLCLILLILPHIKILKKISENENLVLVEQIPKLLLSMKRWEVILADELWDKKNNPHAPVQRDYGPGREEIN